MNTNSRATVNTTAATAAIAITLLIAVLFGAPPGAATAQPVTGVVAQHVAGQ